MGAPYFGAYFATMALANADRIAPLDDGTTPYAAYAIYENCTLSRVLLYNSDYYANGSRSTQTFTLTGLNSTTVMAKRLTAFSATARVDQGSTPTVAGQHFENGTCKLAGTEVTELSHVSNGQATFTLAASEALLLYL